MGNNQSEEEANEVYNREVASGNPSPPPQLIAETNKKPRSSNDHGQDFPHFSFHKAPKPSLSLRHPSDCADTTGNVPEKTGVAAQSKLKQFSTHFVEALKKPTPQREYDCVDEASAMEEELTHNTESVPVRFVKRFVEGLKHTTPMREYDDVERDSAAMLEDLAAEDISALSRLLPQLAAEQDEAIGDASILASQSKP
jgi:hypothetical protein